MNWKSGLEYNEWKIEHKKIYVNELIYLEMLKRYYYMKKDYILIYKNV